MRRAAIVGLRRERPLGMSARLAVVDGKRLTLVSCPHEGSVPIRVLFIHCHWLMQLSTVSQFTATSSKSASKTDHVE